IGLSCSTCLPRLRCLINSAMPPLYLNCAVLGSPVFGSVVRSSVSVISRPLFRNANSRKRWASVSKLYSVTVKMLLSGTKCTFVPRLVFTSPAFFSLLVGSPLEYVCSQVKPSRQISRSSSSLSAFTQETPTPCSPPETLYEDASNLPPACSVVITTC